MEHRTRQSHKMLTGLGLQRRRQPMNTGTDTHRPALTRRLDRPLQILTNNLLYDFSQVPIPTDDVDLEQIAAPRPWSMNELPRFIFFIGPCSSLFDYTTFFLMRYGFACWSPQRAAPSPTGGGVGSLVGY